MDRIITSSELHGLGIGELSALFRRVSLEAETLEPGSPERRDALVSLENIQRVIASRQQFKPPGF